MYHFIYKTTNLINGKYYIGRHSTKNLHDGYVGSGKHLLNAVKKYGKENFKVDILEFANNTDDLWALEEKYITEEMINDETCYNMTFGGKSRLASLKRNDYDEFIKNQKKAGKLGGQAAYESMSAEQKAVWHRKGRAASPGCKGKTWKTTSFTKQKQSDAAFRRIKYKCDHCGKEYDKQNMAKHTKTFSFLNA